MPWDEQPDKAMGYSVDSYEHGKWVVAYSGVGNKAEAIKKGEYYWFSLGRIGHVHVWRNGTCVFDSHGPEPHVEPENR